MSSITYLPKVDGLSTFGDYSPVSVSGDLVCVAGQFGTDGIVNTVTTAVDMARLERV